MYQSVMAKRQGIGSSGTGFAFVLAEIKELRPEQNICLAKDLQTGDMYDVGLNKRGETAWPQLGDKWLLDRSMGHWMLQSKVTEEEAPAFTGVFSTMDPDVFRLASLLKGLGLITDATVSGTLPVVTGSRAQITPAVQQILSILDARGVLDDQTTAAPFPVDTWQTPTLGSGWTPYTASTAPKYKLNYDNTVTIEGRAIPPATVTAGDLLFTMNAACAPPSTKYSTAMIASGYVGNVIVGTDGTVKIFDIPATPAVSRLLFHIRFSRNP